MLTLTQATAPPAGQHQTPAKERKLRDHPGKLTVKLGQNHK
jgi:hypothetical protein